MNEFSILMDLVLVALTIGLAWGALSSRSMRQGVALFIALGLVVGIVWARLAAPDLAIAEVAIGSGITGALLIAAMHDLASERTDTPKPFIRLSINLCTAVFTLLVAYAFFFSLTEAVGDRLEVQVFAHLEQSGVSNPVTAVLLNFRSYDTLLELVVLLAAALGIRAIGVPLPVPAEKDSVLRGLTTFLVPALILTGCYLLWVGAHAPGGAFQAAAILASALVILRLGGQDLVLLLPQRVLDFSLVAGTAFFLLAGMLVAVWTNGFLRLPENWAGILILIIEVFATLSIAVALGLAFAGGDTQRRSKRYTNNA